MIPVNAREASAGWWSSQESRVLCSPPFVTIKLAGRHEDACRALSPTRPGDRRDRCRPATCCWPRCLLDVAAEPPGKQRPWPAPHRGRGHLHAAAAVEPVRRLARSCRDIALEGGVPRAVRVPTVRFRGGGRHGVDRTVCRGLAVARGGRRSAVVHLPRADGRERCPSECHGPGSQRAGSAPVVTRAEEYGLPVFHLSFEGTLTAGGYRPAQLVYRGHRYTAEAKYRGATSSVFPKRNYTFKFTKEDPFNEPTSREASPAGATWCSSPASMTTRTCGRGSPSTLWNRMSPDHIQVKTFSAVLYVNGRYWGLFTVADHMDEHLWSATASPRMETSSRRWRRRQLLAARQGRRAQAVPAARASRRRRARPRTGGWAPMTRSTRSSPSSPDSDRETFRAQWASRLNTPRLRGLVDLQYGHPRHGLGREECLPLLRPRDARPLALHPVGPRRELRPELGHAPQRLHGPHGLLRRQPALRPHAGGALHRGAHARALPVPAARPAGARRWCSSSSTAMRAKSTPWPCGTRRAGAQQYRTFERWSDRTDFTTHEQEVEYLRRWCARGGALERRRP